MSIDVISYEEFVQEASKYTVSVVVLKLDDEKYVYLDILKLLREQPLVVTDDTGTSVNVTTWELLLAYLSNFESDILQSYLTCTIVPRYWQIGPKDKENATEEAQYELTPFYSNIGTELKIVSIENSFGYKVNYCDHNDFYRSVDTKDNTVSEVSWNNPDLSISITSTDVSINLNNTIPIVNGIAFYPDVITNAETGKEELIAYEAGKWVSTSCWNQSNVKTVKHNKIFKNNQTVVDIYDGGETPLDCSYCYNKGIMLLDFSSFGDINIIKLSDCVNGSIQYYDESSVVTEVLPTPSLEEKQQDIHRAYIKGEYSTYKSSFYTIQFDLPKGTEYGVPIVCICGRFFYLQEDTEISLHDETITLTVRIDRTMLEHIIMSNLQWYGKQISGTGLIKEVTDATLEHLFDDPLYNNGTPEDIYRILYEDNSVPFVIMLHTDKKLICTKTRPIMTIGPDKFLFPSNTGGLLVNTKTREIVDYVRQHFASGMLVETAMLRPIHFIKRDYKHLTNRPLGYEFNRYVPKSKYEPLDYSKPGRDLNEYVLIDFAYVE